MAEWGNGQNIQEPEPMDSNGQKLKVRNSSGAYEESDYRVDIEESGFGLRALRVNGRTLLTGPSSGPDNFQTIIRDESTPKNALKVDAKIGVVRTVDSEEEWCGSIEGVVDEESGVKSLDINTHYNNDAEVHIGRQGVAGERHPALLVRTADILEDEEYRVEIKELGSLRTLRSVGKTHLEQVSGHENTLEVLGKTTMGFVEGLARTYDIILEATGRTILRKDTGEDATGITLEAYGKTILDKFDPNQTDYVLVAQGKVGILGTVAAGDPLFQVDGDSKLGGDLAFQKFVYPNLFLCGGIRPKVVNNQGELQFNAENGDPDMVLGHNTNKLTINSEVVLNGPITSGATIEGPLNVASLAVNSGASISGNTNCLGNLTVGTSQQPANLSVKGTTESDGNLTVGTVLAPANATVYGASTLRGVVTVGTTQNPANATINGDADVNGNVDISGNTNIHGLVGIDGATTIQGNCAVHGVLIGEGATECHGTLTVNSTSALKGAVTVGTTQANANTTMNGNLTAKNITGNAISALTGLTVGTAQAATTATLYANVDVSKKLEVADLATLKNGIDFNDSGTIFSIRRQNNQFEFLIGGTRVFYIDLTGGHNG